MVINGPLSLPGHKRPCGWASLCEAGGLSHRLTVLPLTAFPSLNQLLLLQNKFNNTCQLLKCLGFVLWVISLTGVIRTTYQLLLTSWQWRACYGFSEMIHTSERNDLVKQGWEVFWPKRSHWYWLQPKAKEYVAFWLLNFITSSLGCKLLLHCTPLEQGIVPVVTSWLKFIIPTACILQPYLFFSAFVYVTFTRMRVISKPSQWHLFLPLWKELSLETKMSFCGSSPEMCIHMIYLRKWNMNYALNAS